MEIEKEYFELQFKQMVTLALLYLIDPSACPVGRQALLRSLKVLGGHMQTLCKGMHDSMRGNGFSECPECSSWSFVLTKTGQCPWCNHSFL